MEMNQEIFMSVQTADPRSQQAAHALAERLDLPVVAVRETSVDAGEAELTLVFTDDGLELRDCSEPALKGVRADFAARDYRPGSRSMSRRQPLWRAIGKKTKTVLDATAGLGRDAALLACLGYRVTAVERSPIIAALLEDGLHRAREDPRLAKALGDRLTVVCADAREVLDSMETKPDAVYVDPMFPPKRKASALPKKHIRLLRAVVGDDPDATGLVATALANSRRVIVKRPDYAQPLAANPTMTFPGKLVRYDVYVK